MRGESRFVGGGEEVAFLSRHSYANAGGERREEEGPSPMSSAVWSVSPAPAPAAEEAAAAAAAATY